MDNSTSSSVIREKMEQQIAETKAAGPGQIALSAWLRNEISITEACEFVAHSTPDDLEDYLIRPYSQPSAALVDYIGSRAQGLVKRDSELAIANGAWLHHVWSTYQLNQHDIEFLLWSLRLLKRRNEGSDALKRIENHIGQYELNVFPVSLYEEGRQVQKMDLEERLRGGFDRKR